MDNSVKVFPLKGVTIKGIRRCIEDTLISERLFSSDLLYRFYTSRRIPIVQTNGNDRIEEGYDPSKLERQLEPGYDLSHTIWADTLDNLEFHTNKGRNLLLFSGVSVYDRSKTKGKATYHTIETDNPKDALVAIFRRYNSPLIHLAGKAHLTFTQGPVALWESLTHDHTNVIGYLKG
jgi:hypothetical protein